MSAGADHEEEEEKVEAQCVSKQFFCLVHKVLRVLYCKLCNNSHQLLGKKRFSLFGHCALRTGSSTSGVRHWSSSCLIFLARLWQAYTAFTLTYSGTVPMAL